MFEFLNTVAQEYPQIAILLALVFTFGFVFYYMLKTSSKEREHYNSTISRQHKEALDMSRDIKEAHVKNTEVLMELKTIISTLNK